MDNPAHRGARDQARERPSCRDRPWCRLASASGMSLDQAQHRPYQPRCRAGVPAEAERPRKCGPENAVTGRRVRWAHAGIFEWGDVLVVGKGRRRPPLVRKKRAMFCCGDAARGGWLFQAGCWAGDRRSAWAGSVFHGPSTGAVPSTSRAPVGGRWETRSGLFRVPRAAVCGPAWSWHPSPGRDGGFGRILGRGSVGVARGAVRRVIEGRISESWMRPKS